MSKCIVLTGGGTAGHVTPNLALIEALLKDGWQIHYIGSVNGIEQTIIKKQSIPYYAIECGKLRRYFSWRTFFEPFNILMGIVQSYRILHRLKPNLVFSKGGFVAFPVVVGAYFNRIPVIVHESDMTPGLANRLSFPFADKICVSFPSSSSHIRKPVEWTGTPIRQQLLQGLRDKGLQLCGFDTNKPCLLVIGGSMGANAINQCVRASLDMLRQKFQVIHITGTGKIDASLVNLEGYCQFEYVNEDLAHLFAASDVVVSRAGANSVFEVMALAKPHVFIPLSERVSRGDQVQNARYFEEQGISVVLNEELLSTEALLSSINEAYSRRKEITAKMQALQINTATTTLVGLINTTAT